MERIEISEDRRLADLVAAVERGEEVVIVRDGAVVAEVRATGKLYPPMDIEELERFHTAHPLPPLQSAARMIREMRDMDSR